MSKRAFRAKGKEMKAAPRAHSTSSQRPAAATLKALDAIDFGEPVSAATRARLVREGFINANGRLTDRGQAALDRRLAHEVLGRSHAKRRTFMTKRKSPAQLDRDIAHALARSSHASIKGPAEDTTASLVEFLAVHGIERGSRGGALGAIRLGGSTAFVRERTDGAGNVEITVQHPSSRGTSRQRFSSRDRALADLRRQIEVSQRFGGKSHATKLSKASARAKTANDQIYDLIHNKYFQSIPNDDLFSIVKKAGFRFDPEEEEFILVGRDGKATWQLYDAETGREVNHMLVLNWHKLDRTGKYEVVAYIS